MGKKTEKVREGDRETERERRTEPERESYIYR